jgi:hypothetical protein
MHMIWGLLRHDSSVYIIIYWALLRHDSSVYIYKLAFMQLRPQATVCVLILVSVSFFFLFLFGGVMT